MIDIRITRRKGALLIPSCLAVFYILYTTFALKGGQEQGLKIYTYNNGWVMNTTVCKEIEHLKGKPNFQKRPLQTMKGEIQMYIHDPDLDYISSNIHTYGMHDHYVFLTVWKFIKDNPDMNFIDIGANLGIFSLHFANLGRKILSLEASYECVQHECASVLENGLEKNIKIVHNAVGSDHNVDANLLMPNNGQYGTSFIENEQQKQAAMEKYGKNNFANKGVNIKFMTLDDLLDLPNFKENFKMVFIKIDIEGFEHKALEGAKNFFKNIDVKGVYMEWDWHRYKPTAQIIIQFMTKLNFKPFYCDLVVQESIHIPCPKTDLLNPPKEKNFNIVWIP